jgi:hypothetical protein
MKTQFQKQLTAPRLARMSDGEVLDLVDAHPNPGAMGRLNADLKAAAPEAPDVHPMSEHDDPLIDLDSNGLA